MTRGPTALHFRIAAVDMERQEQKTKPEGLHSSTPARKVWGHSQLRTGPSEGQQVCETLPKVMCCMHTCLDDREMHETKHLPMHHPL